jgi:hypothetical protein
MSFVPFTKYNNFDECFTKNQVSPHQFYISKVIKRNDKDVFEFYNFETPQSLYIYIHTIHKKIYETTDPSKIKYYKNLLTFNECLLPFQPRKIYYDIDIPSNECSSESAENIKDDLITSLIEHLDIKDLSKEIMVITAHREDKYSYHILLPLVGINIELPEDLSNFGIETKRKWANAIRDFHLNCMSKMSEENKKYVDTSIYSYFQNFRMLHQSKLNYNNPFVYSEWRYKNQIIPKYIPEIDCRNESKRNEMIDKFLFERSCISDFTNFTGSMIELELKMEEKVLSQFLTFDFHLSEDPRNIFRKMYPNLPLNDGHSTSGQDKYFNLINVNGYLCPLCNRIHEHQNPYLFIKKELWGLELWFHCRRNKDSLLISKLDEVKKIPIELENKSESIEEVSLDGRGIQEGLHGATGPKEFQYLIEPRYTHTYNEKYCLPIQIPENSIYFLSAGLGKGKTKVIIDFIKEKINKNPDIRILILSPRQIFAASLLDRINQEDLNFECYLNLKPSEYNNHKRFIVQMESLQHIHSNYDMIIIDEIESCLAQFESGETMKSHLKSCCDTFERLIKSSTYIICCDAFLSTKSTHVMSKISNKKKIICKNTSTLVRRKALEYDTIMSLIESLIQDLKLNKKIFFVSASKEKVDYLEKLILKHLPEKKYKIYHSSSKEKIKNVNQDWKDVDLVVVSPSVTVGVNYDLEDVDVLYLYGSPNSCCVRDIFQSSMRVRHIKENIMKFSICKAFQSKNKDESIFSLKNIAERILEDKTFQKDFYQCVIQNPRSDGIVYLDQNWTDMSNWMFLNKVYSMKEKNQSRSFYKRIFYYYLGICNYEYDMNEQIRLETKINLYEFKKEIEYTNIPVIQSSEEAKEKIKKIREDPDSYLVVMKFNFNKTIKTEKMSLDDINKMFMEYINPITRKKFYNVKREKNNCDYNHIDQSDLIRNIFWENSDKSAIKIFKIKEINSILGIRNSCESKILSVQETNEVINKIYPMYDELCKIFNIKEQVLKKDIDVQREKRVRVKFVLDQIFQKWNGSKFEIISKQKMINRQRNYIYSFSKNLSGVDETTLINFLK